MRCAIVTSSFPFLANSGQYVATRSSGAISPRSISISATRATIVFVVEYTLVMVSFVHGAVRLVSAKPPQRSTTTLPRSTTATDAPRSAPDSRFLTNTSRTAENRGSQSPVTLDTPRRYQ